MLPVRRKQVKRLCPRESRRVQVALQVAVVQEQHDHFLARRGWGSIFHVFGAFFGENLANFPGVMLFLPVFFVKLLVLKGLASESPPIDREGQDP
jgi:hypothetical protein